MASPPSSSVGKQLKLMAGQRQGSIAVISPGRALSLCPHRATKGQPGMAAGHLPHPLCHLAKEGRAGDSWFTFGPCKIDSFAPSHPKMIFFFYVSEVAGRQIVSVEAAGKFVPAGDKWVRRQINQGKGHKSRRGPGELLCVLPGSEGWEKAAAHLCSSSHHCCLSSPGTHHSALSA